jgi:hypothetical protein
MTRQHQIPDTEPTHIVRVTRLSVLPPNDPLFSNQCTDLSIVDEAAGEFLKIEQQNDDPAHQSAFLLTTEEWPAIKQAIETLLSEIQQHQVTPPNND